MRCVSIDPVIQVICFPMWANTDCKYLLNDINHCVIAVSKKNENLPMIPPIGPIIMR